MSVEPVGGDLVLLRVAIPERGVVAERAEALLGAAGHVDRIAPAGVVVRAAPGRPVRVYRLPERDIAVHAVHGGLHLAVCGSLAVEESSTAVPVVVDMGATGHVLTAFAPPDGARTAGDLVGARVATPFPNIVRHHLAARRIAVRAVLAVDPVDHAIDLGIADAVVALVDPVAVPPGLSRMRVLGEVAECRLVVVEGAAPLDASLDASRAHVLGRWQAARQAEAVQWLHVECRDEALSTVTATLNTTGAPDVRSTLDAGYSVVTALVGRHAVTRTIDLLVEIGCRTILTFDPTTYDRGSAELEEGATAVPGPRAAADRDGPRAGAGAAELETWGSTPPP